MSIAVCWLQVHAGRAPLPLFENHGRVVVNIAKMSSAVRSAILAPWSSVLLLSLSSLSSALLKGLTLVVHIPICQLITQKQVRRTNWYIVLGVLWSAHPRCLLMPLSTTVVVVTFLHLVPEWQTSFPGFTMVSDIPRQWLWVLTALHCSDSSWQGYFGLGSSCSVVLSAGPL